MACPRFFIDQPLAIQQHTELPQATSHHAMRTLRLRENDEVTVFNGLGGEYQARIYFKDKHSWIETFAFSEREVELQGSLHLVQALVANEKMDWIIEKAVELGVQYIHPIRAERSIIKLNDERVQKRLQHWQSIIVAATEQSGRNRLAQLSPPQTLQQYLTNHPAHTQHLKLVCHPSASLTLQQSLSTSTTITSLALLIGPEGGWSDQELQLCEKHQVQASQFGARILRTETAGIALSAACITALNWY